MDSALSKGIFKQLKTKETDELAQKRAELRSIIESLRQCERELKNNESRFNLLCEDLLIEAVIYEREGLLKRHRHLNELARRAQADALAV